MRVWQNGFALPCQGRLRGFDYHHPLHWKVIMGCLNVSVREFPDDIMIVSFAVRKSLLNEYNSHMPLDTARIFGEMLLEEMTDELKEEKRKERGE